MRKIPKKDLDYVEVYAEKLKHNSELFKQQKELIESQLSISSALTKKGFQGKILNLK